MTTQLTPYLQFRDGRAEEAMTFYQSVLGGKLDLMRFADMGGMGVPEGEQQLVMHSALSVNEAVTVMGADVPSTHPGFDQYNVHVALMGDEEATLKAWFDGLADGGHVDVPLEKAPWGDSFGQVKDKFGINWMVNVAG